MSLKHPRKLKRRHKVFLSSIGLDPKEWWLVKDTTEFLEIVNKTTRETKIFYKKGEKYL